jgi:hypothetical protein
MAPKGSCGSSPAWGSDENKAAIHARIAALSGSQSGDRTRTCERGSRTQGLTVSLSKRMAASHTQPLRDKVPG